MQAKSYKRGSACPACEPGKLRIYSMRFCPYAERVLLVAAAKNIPHEIVNVNLRDKPEWLFEKNADGLVPILEQNGKLLTESLIISDYLEEIFPNNSLENSDPYQKALDKLLIGKFGKVTSFIGSNASDLLTGDSDKWEELFNLLENWEDELTNRDTVFFGGNRPGMVDYMLWPWFERLEAYTTAYELDPIPKSRFPAISAWYSQMLLDPAVKKCIQPAEFYKGFQDSKAKGNTNYDYGL